MTFRTNKRQRRLGDEEPVEQVLNEGHRRTERDREDDLPPLAPLLILPAVSSLNLKARSASQDGLQRRLRNYLRLSFLPLNFSLLRLLVTRR